MRWFRFGLFGAAFSVLPETNALAAPPGSSSPPATAAAAPATTPTAAPPATAPPPATTGAAPGKTPAPAPGPSSSEPPGDSSKKGPAPPPEYYVEQQKRAGSAPAEGPPVSEIYEPPPPPTLEAPAPPPLTPNYVAPKTAFWAGLRVSYFVPFGTLWFDGAYDGVGGLTYRRRLFSAYASPGPAAEVDLGARLGRRYNVFALWEHASLGTGNLDPDSFGGQQRGATNLYGVGFRFSTQPDTVGFLLEIGVGYRTFDAYWADGTQLSLRDTFFDGRIGLGADIRVNKWLSLSPMVVFGGGAFTSGEFSGPSVSGNAYTPFDQEGQYGTLALQLGAHADVF
jgi:hypothetical protein